MIDKKKLKIIIPAAAALVLLILFIIIVVNKDAIIDLLTPDTKDERIIFYNIFTIAGIVILYLSFKHVSIKNKLAKKKR